jgi:hypothetical protein
MMNKFKLVVIILGVYLFGFYSGINLQNVNAIVKAPGENNQQQVSPGQRNVTPAGQIPAQGPPQITPSVMPVQNEPLDESDQVINQDNRPVSPAASAPGGVTLYSLSNAMQVDIERLEEDVASLKNKVNILSNMRE